MRIKSINLLLCILFLFENVTSQKIFTLLLKSMDYGVVCYKTTIKHNCVIVVVEESKITTSSRSPHLVIPYTWLFSKIENNYIMSHSIWITLCITIYLFIYFYSFNILQLLLYKSTHHPMIKYFLNIFQLHIWIWHLIIIIYRAYKI